MFTMFSCLWQLWSWIDPKSMEKETKKTLNSNMGSQEYFTESQPEQNQQQQIASPYYPMVNHQHSQVFNNNHQHLGQKPFLFNVIPGQQIPHTFHKHSQCYPQYPVHQNENIVHYHHQHNLLPNLPQVNTLNKQSSSTQSSQTQVEYNENGKDNQAKAPPIRPKAKEGDKIQLRSPSARRPVNAPVTMQGWLHKQGSEGLMFWKKRWFVLSEYCLFYYKGTAEDKVLGSILLPSYKVSICSPEDKIHRKYSFKCEHINMRTYVLAADSQDLMLQWVHVLNLACNLQTNVNVDQSSSRTPVKAAEVSTYNSNVSRDSVQMYASSNMTDLSNSSQQELSQYNQPLYANAPPKPRRLTDSFRSPTPDVSACPCAESQSNEKSPSLQEKHAMVNSELMRQNCLHICGEHPLNIYQTGDRRTPDTYGRSRLIKPRNPNPSDYEDIYLEQNAYKRPLSPIGGMDGMRTGKGYPVINCIYKGYTPFHVPDRQKHISDYKQLDVNNTTRTAAIFRPHSADFLEYNANQNECDNDDHIDTPIAKQVRPKSSLDIHMYAKQCETVPHLDRYFREIIKFPNKNETDNYFYSQERYAEKMRKSAQYLQKVPIKYQCPENVRRKHEETYNTNLTKPHAVISQTDRIENTDVPAHRNIPDQFTRSASARLSQNFSRTAANLDDKISIEGERKREESMKRLLEWKQRMLQSPLNRKSQGYKIVPRKESDFPSYQNYSEKKIKKTSAAGRKAAYNMAQYNSYSSDDEEIF